MLGLGIIGMMSLYEMPYASSGVCKLGGPAQVAIVGGSGECSDVLVSCLPQQLFGVIAVSVE